MRMMAIGIAAAFLAMAAACWGQNDAETQVGKSVTSQQPEKATETLIGRGNRAAVVRNGHIEEIDLSTLQVPTSAPPSRGVRAPTSAPTKPETAESKTPPADGGQAPSTEKEGGEAPSSVKGEPQPSAAKDGVAKDGVAKDGVAKDGVAKDGVAKDGVAKDGVAKDGVAKDDATKKALAELTRKQDIQRIRELQGQNAWFYSKDNVPLSPEELERRIQSGDVGDIKALDIYLKEWKSETPGK